MCRVGQRHRREPPAFAGLIKEDNYIDFTGRAGRTIRDGTHCAGIIFGRPIDGRRIAVAPGIRMY